MKIEKRHTSSKSAAAPIGVDSASWICFMFSVCSLISSIVLSTSSIFLKHKDQDFFMHFKSSYAQSAPCHKSTTEKKLHQISYLYVVISIRMHSHEPTFVYFDAKYCEWLPQHNHQNAALFAIRSWQLVCFIFYWHMIITIVTIFV